MYKKTTAFLLLLAAVACCTPAASADQPTTEKTLVAWGTLDNLTQRGGSALTVQAGKEFDAIVFGERAPAKWMAGSHVFQRTEKDQDRNPVETADAQTLVQMAVMYRGDRIAIYRDGERITEYAAANIDQGNNSRWDCIYAIPREGGGLYGYWTTTPRGETGGRFGFGESADSVAWEVIRIL